MTKKKSGSHYRKVAKTVTVVIEKGMVGNVVAPIGVNVVIKDYDINGAGFTDSELKTDAKKRRYAEEVWEGQDA